MPGTLKRVKIFGHDYFVTAESDANLMGGNFENTPISHTGGATMKGVRRTDSITGIILHLTAEEHDRLKQSNDSQEKGNLSVTDADGNTYRATGGISYNGMGNQENNGTVDLHPTGKDGFTLFVA